VAGIYIGQLTQILHDRQMERLTSIALYTARVLVSGLMKKRVKQLLDTADHLSMVSPPRKAPQA